MKVTETFAETVTRERIISTKCDKCGVNIMESEHFDTRDFKLEFTQGQSYPDSGHYTGWQVEDLCDSCASDLRALIEGNGYRISKVDVDW